MPSDSEDDCSGNMSKKTKKMKNKSRDKPVENNDFLDESDDLNEKVKNNPLPAKKKRKSARKTSDEDTNCSGKDLPDVSADNGGKTTSRRTTRISARKNKNTTSTASKELEEELPEMVKSSSKARKRKASESRGKSKNKASNELEELPEVVIKPSSKARKNKESEKSATTRGRGGARGRGRGTARSRARGKARRGGGGGNRFFWAPADPYKFEEFMDRFPEIDRRMLKY